MSDGLVFYEGPNEQSLSADPETPNSEHSRFSLGWSALGLFKPCAVCLRGPEAGDVWVFETRGSVQRQGHKACLENQPLE